MTTIKKSIGKYILELLIVTFGVVLGFINTDFRTSKAEQEKMEESILLIRSELETNRTRLEKSVKYHESLDSALFQFTKGKGKAFYKESFFMENNGFSQIPNWKGPGISVIEDYVFETIKDAQLLAQYDLQITKSLTKCYKAMESYSQMTDNISKKVFDFNTKTTNEDVLFLLELLKSDARNFETSLVVLIDKTLEALP